MGLLGNVASGGFVGGAACPTPGRQAVSLDRGDPATAIGRAFAEGLGNSSQEER